MAFGTNESIQSTQILYKDLPINYLLSFIIKMKFM